MFKLLIIAALAGPLAGCFQEETNFEHCERNGLKIGSDEFSQCEKTLNKRDLDQALSRILFEESKRNEAEAKRLEPELQRKAAKMRAAQ